MCVYHACGITLTRVKLYDWFIKWRTNQFVICFVSVLTHAETHAQPESRSDMHSDTHKGTCYTPSSISSEPFCLPLCQIQLLTTSLEESPHELITIQIP